MSETETWWPGGDDPTLTREDRIILFNWSKKRTAGHPHINGNVAQALSALKRYSPRVFDHVCRTDAACMKIALWRGWLEDASDQQSRMHYTEEERKAVRKTAEAAIAALKRERPKSESKPAPLTPEQLAAMRDTDPRVQTARAHASQNQDPPMFEEPL